MCRHRILHTTIDAYNRRTFYDILDLNRDCTAKEVRDAYLQKCKQYHPDSTQSTGSDSKFKFQEINEAYSTLSNQQKRHEYDLTLGPSNYRSNGAFSNTYQQGAGDLNDFYRRVRVKKRENVTFTEEEIRRRAEDVHRQYQQYEQYHRDETDYQRMAREYRNRIEKEWYEERQRRQRRSRQEVEDGEALFYRLFLFFTFLFFLSFLFSVLEDGFDYRRSAEEERKMMEELERIENERRRRS